MSLFPLDQVPAVCPRCGSDVVLTEGRLPPHDWPRTKSCPLPTYCTASCLRFEDVSRKTEVVP